MAVSEEFYGRSADWERKLVDERMWGYCVDWQSRSNSCGEIGCRAVTWKTDVGSSVGFLRNWVICSVLNDNEKDIGVKDQFLTSVKFSAHNFGEWFSEYVQQ